MPAKSPESTPEKASDRVFNCLQRYACGPSRTTINGKRAEVLRGSASRGMTRAHASKAVCARKMPRRPEMGTGVARMASRLSRSRPLPRPAAFPSLRMTDAETVEIDERLSKAVPFGTVPNRHHAEMIRTDPARVVQVCKMPPEAIVNWLKIPWGRSPPARCRSPETASRETRPTRIGPGGRAQPSQRARTSTRRSPAPATTSLRGSVRSSPRRCGPAGV